MNDTPPPLPPQPPPFGDPAGIDRDNAKAVRKGVAFGCGGCALVMAIGVLSAVGIMLLVMTILRNSEPCVQSLRAAQSSEVMQSELGEPMHMGWLVTGSISTSNGHGTTDVTVSVVGPAGEASVHTIGTHEDGGPWVFSVMEATIEKTGEKVDLR